LASMNMSHVVAVISLLIREPLLQGCILTLVNFAYLACLVQFSSNSKLFLIRLVK
jgi:hypothetical protein